MIGVAGNGKQSAGYQLFQSICGFDFHFGGSVGCDFQILKILFFFFGSGVISFKYLLMCLTGLLIDEAVSVLLDYTDIYILMCVVCVCVQTRTCMCVQEVCVLFQANVFLQLESLLIGNYCTESSCRLVNLKKYIMSFRTFFLDFFFSSLRNVFLISPPFFAWSFVMRRTLAQKLPVTEYSIKII